MSTVAPYPDVVGLLFLPLRGAFLVIGLALLAIKLFALVDACTHQEAAYQAAGKLSKTGWVVILLLALLVGWFGFLSIVGLIAAIVYLVDVRPALRQLRRRSGSDGPYGPW